MLTSITGINWGDEGKGRMVDLLSQDYDIVARYQGGDNAGHTVKNERGKFVLNLIPSGILRPDVVCVMGGGMVIDPEHLEKEIAALTEKGIEISPKNLKISDRATITMPFHVGFPLLKHGLALGIGGRTLRAPVHELPDVLDLHASLFQTFNDPECFNLRVTEFADAGHPFHVRKKSLFIIIAQRGDRQSEHLCHLSN